MFKLGCVTLVLFLCSFVVSQVEEAPAKDLIVGGISPVPVDDPEVVSLVKVVTDKLSEGDDKERTLIEILEASRQVVSGTLTRLKLKISEGDQERIYKASIWEQPWLNKTEITELKALDDDN